MSDDPVGDPPPEEGAPAWMATFGDMMSLLLCFFVLLLSFANMDVVKFREMMGSMKDAFGTVTENVGEFEVRSTTPIEMSESEKKPVVDLELDSKPSDEGDGGERRDRELLEKVQRFIRDRGLTDTVEAMTGHRGVRVRVKGALLFETASDEFRPEAEPILEEIGTLASLHDYAVSVEGHTDDVPISTDRFRSNWELSTARAVAGVRYLIERGGVVPDRVAASGFAHTRPLERGDSEEAKASNRRIEFVLRRVEGTAAPEGAAEPDLGGLEDALHEAEHSLSPEP